MDRGTQTPGSARRLAPAVAALLAGLLFGAAGILTIVAAELRWGAACAGSWDDPSCLTVQDHRYDYLAPMEQPAASGTFEPPADWVPIPGAAPMAGVALFLVAVAMLLMFVTMRAHLLSRLAQVIVVLAVAMLGIVTTASGVIGHPLPGFNPVNMFGFFIWAMFGPLVLIATTLHWALDPPFQGPLPVAAWRAWPSILLLATPLIGMAISSVVAGGYLAYDSMPWEEAVSGVLYVLTGVIIIAGVGWKAARRSRSRQRGVGPVVGVF